MSEQDFRSPTNPSGKGCPCACHRGKTVFHFVPCHDPLLGVVAYPNPPAPTPEAGGWTNTEAALRAMSYDQLVAVILRTETPGLVHDLSSRLTAAETAREKAEARVAELARQRDEYANDAGRLQRAIEEAGAVNERAVLRNAALLEAERDVLRMERDALRARIRSLSEGA